jgi:TPR repeat protein
VRDWLVIGALAVALVVTGCGRPAEEQGQTAGPPSAQPEPADPHAARQPVRATPVSKDDAEVQQVFAEALTAATERANQGEAAAQKDLGVMYYLGQGVPRDDAQAFEWFTRAAEQRDHVAQYFLGVMHAEGHAVPVDYVQARMWLGLAADQGNREAGGRIEALEAKMNPEQLAEAQRLASEWTSRHP